MGMCCGFYEIVMVHSLREIRRSITVLILELIEKDLAQTRGVLHEKPIGKAKLEE